jgi:uncharacterized protein YjdB
MKTSFHNSKTFQVVRFNYLTDVGQPTRQNIPCKAQLVMLLLAICQMGTGQIAKMDFEQNLDEQINHFDPVFVNERIPEESYPTFVEGSSGWGSEFGPGEGLEFPLSMTSAWLSNAVFSLSMNFKIAEFGSGSGSKNLMLMKGSKNWAAPGFRLDVHEADREKPVRVWLQMVDDNSNLIDGNLALVSLNEWHTLSFTIDLKRKIWTSRVNDLIVSLPFPIDFNIDGLRNSLELLPMRFGLQESSEDSFTTTVTVDNFAFYDDHIPVSIVDYKAALKHLTNSINGTTSIDEEELQDTATQAISNIPGSYPSAKEEVDAFIVAYELKHEPLFSDRGTFLDIGDLDPEARLLFYLQQDLFDNYFTEEHLELVAGVKFEAADAFPGRVSPNAPRNQAMSIHINASNISNWSYNLGHQEFGVRRFTGQYAPPGEEVTVTIDPNLANQGLHVYIGSSIVNLAENITGLMRFPRVSKEFELVNEVTRIANPFGGGIYFRIPEGLDLGWVNTDISGAIDSPYYSTVPESEVDINKWMADINNAFVPWVDIETEQVQFTLPLTSLREGQDISDVLEVWDNMFTSIQTYAGRDVDRPFYAYTVTRFLGAQYPYAIIDDQIPYTSPDQGWVTSVLNVDAYKNMGVTTLHEAGHALNIPFLPGNVESIPQMNTMSALIGLGAPLDTAYKYSEYQLFTIEQAIVDWTMSYNFRHNKEMGNDPDSPEYSDEIGYQHRGHAKHAEMIRLFGLDAEGRAYDIISSKNPDQVKLNKEEYLSVLSQEHNLNMAPLLHFWGVQPSEELAKELLRLPQSDAIYNRLIYYRDLVPKNREEFKFWYDKNFPTIVSEHEARYNKILDEFDDQNIGQQIVDQIDLIINTYFSPVVPVTVISVISEGGYTTIAEVENPLQLYANVYPANASIQEVIWSVVNQTGGASIDQNGLLTGMANGVVEVIAASKGPMGVIGSLEITIDMPVPVTSISLTSEGGNTTITDIQSPLQLYATILPSNASDPAVIWSVSNQTGQATIDQNGVVTGLSNGTVEVSVKAMDDSGASESLQITIDMPVPVNTVSVSSEDGNTTIAEVENPLQLYANVYPANASIQEVIWSVVNQTGGASIDQNGLLTGTANGTVEVIAASKGPMGVIGSLEITIDMHVPVTSISLTSEGGNTTITDIQSPLQLYATILPSNASDQEIFWWVNNQTGQAAIDQNGLLTGIANGTVEVMATSTIPSGIYGSLELIIDMPVPATSISVSSENDLLVIYPNPFSDEIYIDFGKFMPNVSFLLLDMWGNQLMEYYSDSAQYVTFDAPELIGDGILQVFSEGTMIKSIRVHKQ